MTDFAPSRSLDLATPSSNQNEVVNYDPTLPYSGARVGEEAGAPWRKAHENIKALSEKAQLVVNSLVDAKATQLNNDLNASYAKLKVDYSQLQEGNAADQYSDYLKKVSDLRNQYMNAADDPAVKRAFAEKSVDSGNSTMAYVYEHMTGETAKAQDNAHLAALSQIGQDIMMDWANPNARPQHFARLDNEMGYFYAKRGIDPNSEEAKDMRMKAMSQAVGNAIEYEIATGRTGSAQVDLNHMRGQIDMKTWASLSEKLIAKQRENAVYAMQMQTLAKQQRNADLEYQQKMLEKNSKPMDAQAILLFRNNKDNQQEAEHRAVLNLMQDERYRGQIHYENGKVVFTGDQKVLGDEQNRQMDMMISETNFARKRAYDASTMASNAIAKAVDNIMRQAQSKGEKIDPHNLFGCLSEQEKTTLLSLAGAQTGVMSWSDAATMQKGQEILSRYAYTGTGNNDLFFRTMNQTNDELAYNPAFENEATFNLFVSSNNFSLKQRDELIKRYQKFHQSKADASTAMFVKNYDAMRNSLLDNADVKNYLGTQTGKNKNKATAQTVALSFEAQQMASKLFQNELRRYNEENNIHIDPANITVPMLTSLMNKVMPKVNMYLSERSKLYLSILNKNNEGKFIDYIRSGYKSLGNLDDSQLVEAFDNAVMGQAQQMSIGGNFDLDRLMSETAQELLQRNNLNGRD